MSDEVKKEEETERQPQLFGSHRPQLVYNEEGQENEESAMLPGLTSLSSTPAQNPKPKSWAPGQAQVTLNSLLPSSSLTTMFVSQMKNDPG